MVSPTVPEDCLLIHLSNLSLVSPTTSPRPTSITDLPIELIIRILEYGAFSNESSRTWQNLQVDHSFLVSTSVVCRRWAPHAQGLLWEHFLIRENKYLDGLLTSPAFGRYDTRTLFFVGLMDKTWWRWTEPRYGGPGGNVKRLLERLKGLRRVHFACLYGGDLSYEMLCSPSLHGLTELMLHKVELSANPPAPPTTYFPSLERLYFDDFTSHSTATPYTFFCSPSITFLYLMKVPRMMLKNKRRQMDLLLFLSQTVPRLRQFMLDSSILRFLLPFGCFKSLSAIQELSVRLSKVRRLKEMLVSITEQLPLSAPLRILEVTFDKTIVDVAQKREAVQAVSAVLESPALVGMKWVVFRGVKEEEQPLVDPVGFVARELEKRAVKLHVAN